VEEALRKKSGGVADRPFILLPLLSELKRIADSGVEADALMNAISCALAGHLDSYIDRYREAERIARQTGKPVRSCWNAAAGAKMKPEASITVH
jgi:hypothetical protein